MTRYTPIMIMGCTSDAGKSSICTALCRHFANCEVRVAPFKAQVVSLLSVYRSWVTMGASIFNRETIAVEAQTAGWQLTSSESADELCKP